VACGVANELSAAYIRTKVPHEVGRAAVSPRRGRPGFDPRVFASATVDSSPAGPVYLGSTMIDLVEAVALSLWFGAPRRRATAALRAQPDCPFEVLAAWVAGKPDGSAGLRSLLAAADQALEQARRRNIEVVAIGDTRYPPLLAATPDPPVVLWVRGRFDALSAPSVAIVGSRAASPYGLEVAERLGADVAAHGLIVVSGLARGIDSASHRGALEANGPTIAVLGSGADVIYPPEHRDLAAEIVEHGALVSELAPGTPPRPFHFPLRNRIISGLSRGVVVVEAAERSGSLITAECALEQGREVMAVPGSILNGRNGGCHALVKDGAALVETAADVLAVLDAPDALRSERAPEAPPRPADPLVERMSAGESYDFDELCALSGGAAAPLASRLVELELEGAIRRVGGGRFVRSRRTC
jgi:DNA processing protein